MTKFKTLLLTAAAGVPAALLATGALAQSAGVAVIDPGSAMLSAKAIGPAWKTINDQNTAVFTRAQQREQALQATIAPLQKRLDTNNDGRLDEAEAAAAQTAKRPEVQQIVTAQQAAQTELATILQPSRVAQAWVIDQVRQKYRPALNTVATAKRLGVVMTTDTATFVLPANDITDDVTKAIDAALPTATTAPPANWQPDRETLQLYQQFTQYIAVAQQRAAQQQQGAARPAAGTAAPVGTPAPVPANPPRPQGR
ncbi:MAG: OmpH family outer membrane protein [Pseudomonadota bacterium]